MSQTLGRVAMALVVTFFITLMVPFPVYGLFSTLGMAELPEGAAPAEFFLSVVVMKIGVAAGFVLLFSVAVEVMARQWVTYAAIWWLMSTLVEVGQALGPGYSAGNALAGSISEAIYFPLSAYFVARILGPRSTTRPA